VWATVAFILGIAVSVAGNVAHASYPSREALATARSAGEQWETPLGARLMAAFFPIALLLTVEILARVPWPRTLGWSAARYGGAALVAGVAAVVSYAHLNGLLRVYGEDELTARIGPLSVDGLMVVSGFALLAIGRHTAEVSQQSVDITLVEPAREHAPALAAIDAPEDTGHGLTVVTLPEDEAAIASARERFAEVIAAGDVPSVRALRRELRIGHPRAVRLRAALAEQ
jgi:uncharacterized protein DUF2637